MKSQDFMMPLLYLISQDKKENAELWRMMQKEWLVGAYVLKRKVMWQRGPLQIIIWNKSMVAWYGIAEIAWGFRRKQERKETGKLK